MHRYGKEGDPFLLIPDLFGKINGIFMSIFAARSILVNCDC